MVSLLPCIPIECGMNSAMHSPQRNRFRQKKKLTRLHTGGGHGQTSQQFTFPPELRPVPKLQNAKVHWAIPHIVIDTVDDEKPLENTYYSKRRGSSFTRPGLNCNSRLLQPSSAVCSAVSANDPSALKNVILSGTVNIDQRGTNGATALHEASYDGKVACVNILLQCGADVNVRDREGWTPLHAAVCGRSLECATRLVLFGANVKAKTDDGLTPFAIALQQKDKPMISLLSSFNNQRLKDNFSPKQVAKESFLLTNV